MIRVCVVGLGRTGKEIAKALLEQQDIEVVMAVVSPKSEKAGKDLGDILNTGKTGIIITTAETLAEDIKKHQPHVAIDFSSPTATLENAKVFGELGVKMVVATTGFSKISHQKLFLTALKYEMGMVMAPNITLGVNVLMLLSNLAAAILNNYDFEVIEIHHKYKKDAPSGTALRIAKEIELGLSKNEKILSLYDRGHVKAIRAGGVIGKHSVLIVGENDQLEITHESFSRKAFAEGALRAVKFIYNKTGYFEMKDVLNMPGIISDYLEQYTAKSGFKTRKRVTLLKS